MRPSFFLLYFFSAFFLASFFISSDSTTSLAFLAGGVYVLSWKNQVMPSESVNSDSKASSAESDSIRSYLPSLLKSILHFTLPSFVL